MQHRARFLFTPATFAALLVTACALAQANPAPVVFNTGVDASGQKLAPGSADLHWRIVAGPDITLPVPAVVLTEQHPHGDYFADPHSAWIWTEASGFAGTFSAYVFEQSFDLSGVSLDRLRLRGSWGADDFGHILLNGQSAVGSGTLQLSNSGSTNYNRSHDFSLTGGFVPGINRLQFYVTDTGIPGGLNVSGLVLAVPEPSGMACFATGLLLLAGVFWRRLDRG